MAGWAPWNPWGFYFITDRGLSLNGHAEDARQALAAGAVAVQYREKSGAPRDAEVDGRRREALELLEMARAAGVPFIVNDDIDLALATGADGVHVGPNDIPPAEARGRLGREAILGVSVASAEEAASAQAAGASYVAASPVYATPTKPDAGPAVGLEGLRAVRRATRLPVVAIGGLAEGNLAEVAAAGADMFSAISASLAGGTVEENVRRLVAAFAASG